MMEIQNRIKEWRLRRGMSQARLAAMANTTQQSVQRLEAGIMPVKVQHLRIYARALGVTPIDILPVGMVQDEAGQSRHFNHIEAEPWAPCEANTGATGAAPVVMLPNPLAALAAEAPERSVWIMRCDAMAGAGVMCGDYLLLDAATSARKGDIVCAQVYGPGDTKSVFRFYRPPFLLAAPGAGAGPLDPVLIDERRCRIVGVMTAIVRLRPAVTS